ncbi:MAG: hypothetical protein EBZ47_00915 [Chlamydiae bacterium]|nr:hypothetical protein [Chlamydiota bacterium]
MLFYFLNGCSKINFRKKGPEIKFFISKNLNHQKFTSKNERFSFFNINSISNFNKDFTKKIGDLEKNSKLVDKYYVFYLSLKLKLHLLTMNLRKKSSNSSTIRNNPGFDKLARPSKRG